MSEDGTVELNISLHPAQMEIFNSPARFKVVAAGRRFGKSWLACVMMLLKGLEETKVRSDGLEVDLALEEVYYVAPTFEQAKRIMWPLLKELGKDIIATTHENTATCTIINGRRLSIKGADNPDSLRGVGLSFVVLDEYAFMKSEVWEKIIRPALAKAEGEALFIGTPEGENHFFDIYLQAHKEGLPMWECWSFKTMDNPFINKAEVEFAKNTMSSTLFMQEFEASFAASSGEIFHEKWWVIDENEPREGDYYIAVDLAGFTNEGTNRKKELKIRDETVIAVVRAGTFGWYVKDLIHGQWDVRETALRIMKAYRDYRPVSVGIEKGALKNAVMPYLEDEMKRLDVYFTPIELTHGNQKKHDRIRWALQGRAEKGRIILADEEWTKPFIRQAAQFPSPLAHDDMLDAVSYIDQLASAVYFQDAIMETWEPIDDIVGL